MANAQSLHSCPMGQRPAARRTRGRETSGAPLAALRAPCRPRRQVCGVTALVETTAGGAQTGGTPGPSGNMRLDLCGFEPRARCGDDFRSSLKRKKTLGRKAPPQVASAAENLSSSPQPSENCLSRPAPPAGSQLHVSARLTAMSLHSFTAPPQRGLPSHDTGYSLPGFLPCFLPTRLPGPSIRTEAPQGQRLLFTSNPQSSSASAQQPRSAAKLWKA